MQGSVSEFHSIWHRILSVGHGISEWACSNHEGPISSSDRSGLRHVYTHFFFLFHVMEVILSMLGTNWIYILKQGTIVDRIDYNIQNVAATVEEGFNQLQKVLSYSYYKCINTSRTPIFVNVNVHCPFIPL